MKEYIGQWKNCGKNNYCENGFFNGVLLPGQHYLCYDCDDKEQKKNKKRVLKFYIKEK